VLCLGRVPEFYPRPMLEMDQWALGRSLESVLHTDYWGAD
jgi:5,6-dimethylbenzimidazole synthase